MILVVGNINFDILLPLDRLPGPHEKMACEAALTGFGGSAANAAYWLARMGAAVRLSGAVGADALGQAHLEELRRAGVGVAGVAVVPATTGIAVVFSLGTEKRMVRTVGANVEGKVLPALLDGVTLLYLSGVHTDNLAGYAALARERGVRVLCGWHGAGDPKVARLSDGFILNSDEVQLITGVSDPDEGIRALDSKIAAVTLPTGGCLVSEGIHLFRVPSPEVDPVDRTGGGDAFAAGFLAGLDRGLDVESCGMWGNTLAAEVIMKVGARPGISIPEELRSVPGSQPTADS